MLKLSKHSSNSLKPVVSIVEVVLRSNKTEGYF